MIAATTCAGIRASTQAQPTPAAETSSSFFTVLLQGARVGFENVTTTRSAGGLLITGTGELGPPIDLVTSRFELQYSADGQPIRLSLEGTYRRQLVSMTTIFGMSTATSEVLQGGQRGTATLPISPRTIVLPNNFTAAYEALAARLGTLAAGAKFPVFVAPEGEFTATVMRVTPRRLVTPDRTIEIREFDLALAFPSGPSAVQVWIDERDRLARVALVSASLVAVRDDLSSVLTRVEKIRNAGDADLFIPAGGFNLGATITTPVAAKAGTRSAAVILVASPGPQDRDHLAHGVPIFGHLARMLSEAGYIVVRFDGRGSGQSGGRVENATVTRYADDVAQIAQWLRRRRDVDPDRIAVIGYGTGGAIALSAGAREKRIRAIGLVAAPGLSGVEFTLEEQRRQLDDLGVSPADRQNRIALQQQIHAAVLTGKGWDTIPAAIRRQADTPWFRSWLEFDPRPLMRRLEQPVLVVHGALDAEVPPSHAESLASMSSARSRPPAWTEKTIVPGVNHLLARAATGLTSEYALLPELRVADEVGAAIAAWLKVHLPARSR